MSDRELYRQKKQAQLDEWKAEVDKLRARASGASADRQLALNQRIEALEVRLEEGNTKLAEIAHASDDAWESFKEGVESTWDSMKSAFAEGATQFEK